MLLRHLLVFVWLAAVTGRLLVNDDYCDSLDGSDEPGTSACSHLASAFFPCLSNGRRGVANVSIPTSRISDGMLHNHVSNAVRITVTSVSLQAFVTVAMEATKATTSLSRAPILVNRRSWTKKRKHLKCTGIFNLVCEPEQK